MNVLMIGNSFCYYYPDELVEMAKAAGKNLRICNVYYSGCSIKQHYTWWQNGEANYEFFVRDTNGYSSKVENVSLEYCLNQGNWDIISLQTLKGASGVTPAERLAENEVYLDALFGLLRTRFPEAQLAWHHTWAHQVGTNSVGNVTTPESQVSNAAFSLELSLLVCEKYGVDRINTGDAWRIVREGGYDNLCARLGKKWSEEAPADSGDNYHDGDIGGGQYLNACVWYEYLFGLDVRENSFVPTYNRNSANTGTLDKNGNGTYSLLIDADILRNAAHEAFASVE